MEKLICSNQEQFENLKVNEVLNVPPETNILINDIDLPYQLLDPIVWSIRRKVIVFDKDLLTAKMLNVFPNRSTTQKDVFYLYPLSAGKIVRKTLNKSGVANNPSLNEFEITCIRDNRGGKPLIKFPNGLIELLKNANFADIRIVDDVIVSGTTIKSIKDALEYEIVIHSGKRSCEYKKFDNNSNGCLANIKWSAFSWMTFNSRRNLEKLWSDFGVLNTGVLYKSLYEQPPLNSLSTLFGKGERSSAILNSYARKFAKYPQDFIKIINILKGGEIQ